MSESGQLFGDRYRVSSKIGSGGMAEVYLAQDELLGRTVALKIMHPEYAADRSFIERFRREAQAAARLNDPRVVSIFDWGSDEGTYYIVMEYVDGKTLREALSESGAFSVQQSAETMAEVADALHLAHEQGIIHRDVKPGNIIISAAGATKVTDFGIARAVTETGQTVTQTGTVIGTASYLSPEQAQGHTVDARSDVYSAGVVLFELLTGEVPFTGDTPVSIAYKHVSEMPAPPSRLNVRVPGDLDSIAMKTLSKNPDNRYASADEFGRDLRRFLRGEPVSATPLLASQETMVVNTSSSGPAGTQVIPQVEELPPKRSGAMSALIVLLVIAIIVGVGGLVFFLLGRSSETVVVPDVVGMTLAEAEQALADAGLEGRSQEPREPHDTIPVDRVVRQDPSDGMKLETGGVVFLYLSAGPQVVDVPDLTGLTEDEAKEALQKVGLVIGAVDVETSDEVEQGKVIGQNPRAGSTLGAGEAVSVTVSAGKATSTVPTVVGISEENARASILNRNLVPKVSYVCRTNENDNRVLEQSPDSGTEVAEGSDVKITVNDTIRVPDVEGKTEKEAKKMLEEEGFKVVVTKQDNDPLTDDEVVDQTPTANTVACKDDTVEIIVEE